MIDMANDFKPQLIPTSIIKNKPQSSWESALSIFLQKKSTLKRMLDII